VNRFPEADAWRAACALDATLTAWAGPWSVCFAVAVDGSETNFLLVDGGIRPQGGAPDFTLSAPAAVWSKFLAEIPPRHHHGIFALRYQVPEFTVRGDECRFMQFAHVVRRVLEIGKWLSQGNTSPVPVTLAPRGGQRPMPQARGGYVPVIVGDTLYQIYYETTGLGQDVLCLQTAGSDARQFHGLMADPAIIATHRLVAFDLPMHGKSTAPEGTIPGAWRLHTDLYVDLIMGFINAAGLDRPIALGASMSGEICLELAYRHPESFTGIIACEACETITRRQTPWAAHPKVNAGYFVPEWIRALCAPQSPAEYQEAITWHYAQGGPSVFHGDIAFYSGDWNATDRVGRIDTNRCPLFMLTGEYDYSCTIEMSAATAAKIPGARFQPMPGIGHFPFAENPALFATYLHPILQSLSG
jgi:pimeloyl-ACP methyl ester carboxylesterase